MQRNPALTVELGARALFFLEEEEAVVEATKHYETCPGYFGEDDCQFCFYGPIEDMKGHLRHLPTSTEWHRNDRGLGDPWFF